MQFFNDRNLARRFKEGSVPQRERLYYYLFFSVLTIFMSGKIAAYYAMQSSLTAPDIAEDVLFAVVTVLGTILCYNTNSKGDHKEFIERTTCLSFPVMIQTILLTIVVSLVLMVVGMAIWGAAFEQYHAAFSTSLSAIGTGYFFIRLNSTIAIASGKR